MTASSTLLYSVFRIWEMSQKRANIWAIGRRLSSDFSPSGETEEIESP